MYQVLSDLRVVEGSSFIAAPSCGMHLAQLGAEVIRFDTIGGGPDFGRWPKGSEGASFFWEGMNKGKKSIAIDLRRPEGRALAADLVTAPGPGAGLFITNFPKDGFLGHERLSQKRSDLITVRVMGRADGGQAVDYTVNGAVGFPYLTGPSELGDTPVNHVLPAWDLLAGVHAAFGLLAAERSRRMTGRGQELTLPLFDLALTTLGHLGQIAEYTETQTDRPRYGNALYGAFGRDFVTADSERLMIIAITAKQWTSLLGALAINKEIHDLETELNVSFAEDEGVRFVHRERLFAIVEAAVGRSRLDELALRFDAQQVCWSKYRTVGEALREDKDVSSANPVFAEVAHPSGATYLTPGSATGFSGVQRLPPVRAPRLGEHTEEVLASVLGLPAHEIGRLHDEGVVQSAR